MVELVRAGEPAQEVKRIPGDLDWDTLGRSYENCPACADIDALKSIPATVNAISLGGGGSIALNSSKK